MVSALDSAAHSRILSGIRSHNTKPEMLIRSLLHRHGFRFRFHVRNMPGQQDIVLPRYRAGLFVHG
jgi:DNA mismatch endonuclease (patch repair protein)